MSDSIKVFARVRPFNSAENASERSTEVPREGKSIIVNAPQSTVSASQAAGFGSVMRGMPRAGWANPTASPTGQNSISPNATTQHTFHFDHVYDSSTTQYLLYQQATAPLLDDLMAGYNTCIIAFGQTSSGKTHTMAGSATKDEPVTPTSQHGIIPRFVHGIFDHIEESDESIEFTIKISVMEIYMEKIKDLLSGQDGLRIRDNASNVWVEELTQVYVTSIDEVFAVMEKGQASRSIASTMMNDVSSRSHLIVQITIGQHFSTTGEKRGSQLTFVDLAGSEKVAKTQAEGQTLKEAQHINKSLSALGNVINACAAKLPHVPYRDSKLTHLLRDSIAGNSKTALIITCSPSSHQYDETMSTCRFGQRAATIQNKPIMNRERSIEEYKNLFLNAFRLVVRRTSLLAATNHALEQCVKDHPHDYELGADGTLIVDDAHADLEPEPDVIQRIYLDTNPAMQVAQLGSIPHLKHADPKDLKDLESKNAFFIQPNIIDALREICTQDADADILAFLSGEIINPVTMTAVDGSDGRNAAGEVNTLATTLSTLSTTSSSIISGSPSHISSPSPTSKSRSHHQQQQQQTQQDKIDDDDDFARLTGDEPLKAKLQMYQDRSVKMIAAMKSIETQHGLQVLSLTNDIEAKEQDIIRLRTEVTDSYIHQQSLQDEIQSLQNDITSLQQDKDRQLEKMDQLNVQLEKFTALLKQKDITIKSLCDENNTRQEQQLKYESQLIQRVEKSRFILEQKEQAIKSLNETQTTTRLDLSTLQEQYTALTKTIEQAELEKEQIKLDHQSQLAELKKKLEEYVVHRDEAAKKTLECNILTEQLTLLRQSIDQLKDSVERLSKQNQQYEDELTTLRAENQVYQAQNAPNSDDKTLISDLKSQNVELQKSLTAASGDHQAAKNNLIELGEKYRALGLKLQQSEKDYKTIQNRLHDMDMQLNDRTQRMVQFEQELNQTKNSHNETLIQKQHLQQEITALNDKLAKQQLLYNGLEQQYASSQAYCDSLKAEIDTLAERVKNPSPDSTTTTTSTSTSTSPMSPSMTATMNFLDSKEAEHAKLQKEVLTLANDKDVLKQQLITSKQQIEALEKSLTDTHVLFTDTQDAHLLLDQQYQALNKKFKKLEDNSKDRFLELEKEKHMVRYQYTKLQEEYTALQRTANANVVRLEQNDEVIAALTSKNKEIQAKNEILSLRFDTTVTDTTQQITDLVSSKSELQTYKETTQREIGDLTTKNVSLQQEVLNYKSKFLLLESNLQIVKQQSESTITDLKAQLTACQTDNTVFKGSLNDLKNASSSEVSTLHERFSTLQQQHTAQSSKHILINQELSELKIKYTEEKQMTAKQVASLQKDLQQQIDLHKTWQTQQESLHQEKYNGLQATISKNEEEIAQLREALALAKTEQDSIKRQTSLNLSEQNKYHSQELIVLRDTHRAELKALTTDKNRYLSDKTELEQNCLALQDLNTIQQQELTLTQAARSRLEEKISNLQIQWEQNIHQQMSYEELMQSKLDALEKIIAFHGVPLNMNSDGSYIVPSASAIPEDSGKQDDNKKDRGFFTKFKADPKNDPAVAAQLRIELKQVQAELDDRKAFIDKKEKQLQRTNANFVQKCKDYDELLKEVDVLKGQIEDSKYEMEKLEVLFENPLEITVMRQENKAQAERIKKLTEANKLLQLNEHASRKKQGNIVAPSGATTVCQLPTASSPQVDAMVAGIGMTQAQPGRKNALVTSSPQQHKSLPGASLDKADSALSNQDHSLSYSTSGDLTTAGNFTPPQRPHQPQNKGGMNKFF